MKALPETDFVMLAPRLAALNSGVNVNEVSYDETVNAAKSMRAGIGLDDILSAVNTWEKYKDQLAPLLSFLAGLWNRIKNRKPTVTPPAPTPTPVTPTAPPPTPAQPPAAQRRVGSLRTKWHLFETWAGEGKRTIASKAEFDAIVAQEGYAGLGYRLHVDITPVDERGKAFDPDQPINDQLFLTDPTLGPVEGNNRITHVAVVEGVEYRSGDVAPGETWDGQDVVALTSEYDGYAMTPVLTIARDLELSRERRVSYYAEFVGKDGTVVKSNRTPEVIVKPWAVS